MSYYPTLDRLTIIVLRAANLKKMEPHGTGDDTSFIYLVPFSIAIYVNLTFVFARALLQYFVYPASAPFFLASSF